MLQKEYNSPENRELRRLQKEDKTNGTKKALEYRDNLIAKEEQRLKNASKPGATSDTPKPGAASDTSAAPAGTTKGKLVAGKGYEALDKNGKLVGYFQP
jgi:hypothetical protein